MLCYTANAVSVYQIIYAYELFCLASCNIPYYIHVNNTVKKICCGFDDAGKYLSSFKCVDILLLRIFIFICYSGDIEFDWLYCIIVEYTYIIYKIVSKAVLLL